MYVGDGDLLRSSLVPEQVFWQSGQVTAIDSSPQKRADGTFRDSGDVTQ